MLVAFDSTCLISSFQVSLESITKYLPKFTSLIGTLLMRYVNLRGDFLFVTIRNSHFDVVDRGTV